MTTPAPDRIPAGWSDASPVDPGPDPTGLGALVRAVDDRVDTWFEPLRGKPALDGMAKVITGTRGPRDHVGGHHGVAGPT